MEELSNKHEAAVSPQKKRKKKIERLISPGGVPEIMDIKELSSYLGIGKSKIYAMARNKKIPASRIGRQYRFYKVLVDKWLQEKTVPASDSDLPLFEHKTQHQTPGQA